LAGLASPLVNFTLVVRRTRVLDVALDGAFKERFASLTTRHTIVESTGHIATNQTQSAELVPDGSRSSSGTRIGRISTTRTTTSSSAIAATCTTSLQTIAIIA